MHVAVGSENPAKIEAVERTIERYDPVIRSVAVDSGVRSQPRSIEETVTGATNRATLAIDTVNVDFGVGLEGGVASVDWMDGKYLVMWAVVTDGNRYGQGGGPLLALPPRVEQRVSAGAELGPVLEDLVGDETVTTDRGAIGVCTGGLTDRATALGQAVACAFAPFVTNYYEHE